MPTSSASTRPSKKIRSAARATRKGSTTSAAPPPAPDRLDDGVPTPGDTSPGTSPGFRELQSPSFKGRHSAVPASDGSGTEDGTGGSTGETDPGAAGLKPPPPSSSKRDGKPKDAADYEEDDPAAKAKPAPKRGSHVSKVTTVKDSDDEDDSVEDYEGSDDDDDDDDDYEELEDEELSDEDSELEGCSHPS